MRRPKFGYVLLAALSLSGLLGLLYWSTREGQPETSEQQHPGPQPAPAEHELTSATAELQSDLDTAVAPRESASAMTRIRIYGLPSRVLLPDAACGIRTSRAAVRPLVMEPGLYFECPSTVLTSALLEVGASDYVTIGHRFGDEVPQTLDLELQLSGTLDITVVTGNEKPVPGALISVYPQDTSKPDKLRIRVPELWKDSLMQAHAPLTNAAGTIQMHGYPCDTPLVVGASRAVADVVEKVVIPSSERNARVVLHAPDSGCIRGRLVWPDGSAVTRPFVERFMVCATESRQRHLGAPKTRSGEQGEFELCGLPRGRVTWYVDRIGERSRMTVVDADVVDVGPVQLQDLVTLNGRVFLESAPAGFDYSNLKLRFFKDGSCFAGLRGVRKDGRFHFDKPDGSYRVEVPAGTLTIQVEGPTWPLCALDIEVPTPNLEIRLDPFVAGLRLTDVPVPATDPFLITLHDTSAARARPDATRVTWSSTTYANGGGRLSEIVWDGEDALRLLLLRPGSYDVFITRESTPAFFVGSATLVAGSVATLECPQQGSGGVTGRVVDHDGSPMPGASVGAILTIESNVCEKAHRVETREAGSFAFEGLVSGRWIIYPESLGPLSSSAVRVIVEPGPAQHVELIVAKPGRISGKISRSGVPVPEVGIALWWARPSGTQAAAFYNAKATQQGSYEITDVYPGQYELGMFDHDLWIYRQVIVESARDTIADFELGTTVTPMAFVRDGKILDSLDSASLYTRSGAIGMDPWAGRVGVWVALSDGGPSLALLGSKDTPRLLDPEPPAQCYLAYASACASVGQYTEMEVRGATLKVRASDPRAVLPWACVEGVGELRNLWEPGDGPTLVYHDIDGERRFTHVPVGTTLLLASPRVHSDGMWSQRVVVNNEAEMTIAWPPRD